MLNATCKSNHIICTHATSSSAASRLKFIVTLLQKANFPFWIYFMNHITKLEKSQAFSILWNIIINAVQMYVHELHQYV